MRLNKKQIAAQKACIETLKVQQGNGDTEMAHATADEALCELFKQLGMDDVVKEYNNISKWFA